MHIKKVQFKNIAMFDDVTVDFDKEINTIVGVNGSGKTIFMKLIYCVLNDDAQEILNYCVNNTNDVDAMIKLTVCLSDYEDDGDANKDKHNLRFVYQNVLLHQFKNNNMTIHPKTLENIEGIDFFGGDIIIEYICNKIYCDLHRYNIYLVEKKNCDNLIGLCHAVQSYEQFNNLIMRVNEKIIYDRQSVEKSQSLVDERIKQIKIIPGLTTLTLQYFSKNYNDHFVCRDYTDFRNGLKRYFSNKISYVAVDGKHDAKERLYEIKNTNTKMYLTIRDKYYEITGTYFDMISILDKTETGYKTSVSSSNYYNIKENTKHVCSYGEIELINFLTLYYSNKQTIMLLDEPFNHLSYQLKLAIFRLLLCVKKQIIFITHNIEFVQPQESYIIYFGIVKNENKTTLNVIYFPKTTIIGKNEFDDTVLLTEYKEMLFAKKCLLVEGKSDHKFIKALFECYNVHDYCIFELGGCTGTCYKILDKLKIPYKILFDYDVIETECDNSKNKRANKYLKLMKISVDECKKCFNGDYDKYLESININPIYNVYFWNSEIKKLEGVIKHIEKQNELSFGESIIKHNVDLDNIKIQMKYVAYVECINMINKYKKSKYECQDIYSSCVDDFIDFINR